MRHEPDFLRPLHAALSGGTLWFDQAVKQGIAAASNAPLAGVVFGIQELSRKLESCNGSLKRGFGL